MRCWVGGRGGFILGEFAGLEGKGEGEGGVG